MSDRISVRCHESRPDIKALYLRLPDQREEHLADVHQRLGVSTATMRIDWDYTADDLWALVQFMIDADNKATPESH